MWQRRSQALSPRGFGARDGYWVLPPSTGLAWNEPSYCPTSFRGGSGRQGRRPPSTRGGRDRGVFRPASSRVVNLWPDDPASPTDWDTHSCVLNFFRLIGGRIRSPLRRRGLWGPMVRSVLPARRHLHAPRISSGQRWPIARFVHPLLKYFHVPFNLSGRQELDGPVRSFVERPSFVMGSERPTGTDGLVSSPGRRALSHEYPSSIADALWLQAMSRPMFSSDSAISVERS